MPITEDVLVVGGGLAGSMAALEAAERADRVRLVSAAPSTLRQASGLVDILGYLPGESDPVVAPLEAIDALPADHPYRRVGREGVRAALERFDEVVGEAYRSASDDRNVLVPTTAGTVKPTSRVPASVAPGLLDPSGQTLLVGLESWPRFDAPLAAASLRDAGVPGQWSGTTVRLPGLEAAEATPALVATSLADAETQDVLADSIRSETADRVGLPPVVGAAREALADRLGTPVFELPSGPPSLPGQRLERRLDTALEEAGVRRTQGVRIVEAVGDGTIDRVYGDRDGRHVPFEAAEYVLATGGLVGGGIASSRVAVREPVFGCRGAHPEDRYDWFADAPFGEHPFARFGVAVDDELRPLEAGGDPRYRNLRAAGAVLGGYDFAAESSGSGVSIATGVVAGRRAGEVAA